MPDYRDIPKFIHGGGYAIDCGWGYLEAWLDGYAKDGGLDLDPDFQRGNVWTVEQRRKYVEFVLKGGQSAKSLWWNSKGHNLGSGHPLVIVDGLQRLTAVREYLADRLRIFPDLSESGQHPGGFLRSEFTGNMRMHDATFRMHINNLDTRSEVLRWYLEFNSGGTVHSKEELARVQALLDAEQPIAPIATKALPMPRRKR